MKKLFPYFLFLSLFVNSHLLNAQIQTKDDKIAKTSYKIYNINLNKKGITKLDIKKADLAEACIFTTNLGHVIDYGISFELVPLNQLNTQPANQPMVQFPKAGSDRNVLYDNTNSVGSSTGGATNPTMGLQPHPAKIMFDKLTPKSKVKLKDLMIVDAKGYVRAFEVELTITE